MTQPHKSEANDQQQNLTLLKVYTIYRVLLCCALLTTFILIESNPLVGGLKPEQFLYSTTGYLLLNLIGLVIILPKKTPFNSHQLFANFIFDITAIIVIADASNGVSSGLGILLVVIVAASSIMLYGQLAILIAAIASIAIIADTTSLIGEKALDISSFLPAGLLGMIFFITSFLIQNLATRIRGAQIISERQTADLNRLQLLNQNIVKRMRTGILVADEQGRIQLANAAASELLETPQLKALQTRTTPQFLHPQILSQFKQWQLTPQYHSPPFRATETGPELHASFSALTEENSSDTLIFLEDNRRLTQQAQQIKLASLGRLTASIAHEIRNPLGAISHAAQLLAESETLASADQRLCDIIQKHSRRMNKVIENVLQLSSRNAPNPEKISLNQWLGQFIEEFKSTDTDTSDIKLTEDQHCEITTDSSQLNQILTNLAQNGLRYSQQKTGKATLELRIHINSDTQLPMLDIIDDGPGISSENKEKLFEPFYTTETKGSGLGLYISRELCEANEARLDYIRTDDNRSCFRISFPHPDRRLAPE